MSGNLTILAGDVRQTLAAIPDNSIQCVVTSPPYWGLRDYGTAKWEGGDTSCSHVESRIRQRNNLAAAANAVGGGNHGDGSGGG